MVTHIISKVKYVDCLAQLPTQVRTEDLESRSNCQLKHTIQISTCTNFPGFFVDLASQLSCRCKNQGSWELFPPGCRVLYLKRRQIHGYLECILITTTHRSYSYISIKIVNWL